VIIKNRQLPRQTQDKSSIIYASPQEDDKNKKWVKMEYQEDYAYSIAYDIYHPNPFDGYCDSSDHLNIHQIYLLKFKITNIIIANS
jgi:hypothetical protein